MVFLFSVFSVFFSDETCCCRRLFLLCFFCFFVLFSDASGDGFVFFVSVREAKKNISKSEKWTNTKQTKTKKNENAVFCNTKAIDAVSMAEPLLPSERNGSADMPAKVQRSSQPLEQEVQVQSHLRV